MSADVESFASRAQVAWHGLGTVFDADEVVNTDRMLQLASLDWPVELVPVVTEGNELTTGHYATVRTMSDGTQDVLGVVGERYEVVQNADALRFADNILDGGGRWETAGSLKGGRVVFGAMALEDKITLDPNGAADQIDIYLLIATSHDGSLAVNAVTTPVRVVCSNTLTMGLQAAQHSVKFRHTSSVAERVEQARKALNIAHTYSEAFEAEAQAMIAKQVTDDQFAELFKQLNPQAVEDEAAKAAVTRWENKFSNAFEIWHGPQVDGAGIGGTAWGAFQALTEQQQWHRSLRGENGSENAFAAGANLTPNAVTERDKIAKAVRALVDA